MKGFHKRGRGLRSQCPRNTSAKKIAKSVVGKSIWGRTLTHARLCGAPREETRSMSDFDPSDPLQIDHLLSDEERAIRGAVREFVEGEVLGNIADWYERGIFPQEVMAGVAKLGLLVMHLTGYGCSGSSAVSYGLACM